jgi:UPF0271 protein
MDLNADLGERDEPDGRDDPLLAVVTSAAVACGGHAGSPAVMAEVCQKAQQLGVTLGAHPSYVDREGFGRRPRSVPPRVLQDQLVAQIGTLLDVARGQGSTIRFVKPHGALYNAMADDEALAQLVAEAVRSIGDLVLVGLAGSPGLVVAARCGLTTAAEAFCDRAYLPSGRLAPRGSPGAVFDDPEAVVRQALEIAQHGRVRAQDGSTVPIQADTLCCHGDTPGAQQLARAVREGLEQAGIAVAPFAP